MKKLITGLLIIFSSTTMANDVKSINCRITYNVQENHITSVMVGTKDPIEREKCEKQIRSKETLELFKKQHENYNKKSSAFKYTCVLT